MKRKKWILSGFVILLALALMLPAGCGKKETKEQVETQEMEESATLVPATELPAAVLAAIEGNVPDGEVDIVEVAEEDGITLYDIEFKENRGEIEVADDGTVIDVVTIVTMDDLPEAAAMAIKKATEGYIIERLEKSEVRSEIKTEGDKCIIVKLDTPRYEYEAELVKDEQTAEITVDADGNIIEPLKLEAD